MFHLLSRAIAVYREDGPREVLVRGRRYVYNNILRPQFPLRVVEYNGVKVYGARFGDRFISRRTTDIPSYEDALVSGIRKYVQSGDRVTVIGGGWGVSSVAAAQQVGSRGRVTTFEGSENEIEKVKSTVRLNDVDDRVTAHHAIVAEAHSIRGDKGDAGTVSPTELSDCDVLVLDCEGAELTILDEMAIHPRIILVETHGMHGASKEAVARRLSNLGYEISNRGVAESRMREFCIENDIYVLAGKRAGYD